MRNDVLVVFPARSGSKRIPDKNIRPFCGEPLLKRVVRVAKEAGLTEHIYVDTDSRAYADLAVESGASCPFLRDSFKDDHSPVSLSTVRFLERLQSIGVTLPPVTMQLMVNCPLRTEQNIKEALADFDIHGGFQISAFEFPFGAYQWAQSRDPQGHGTPLFADDLKARSQDLPAVYFPTGAIWIAETEKLLESRNFYGPRYRICPMDWVQALDIDTEEDWRFTENHAKASL
jgi:N-acylneuraminate cytidylyltransferase